MPAGQGSLPIGIRHRLTSLERRYSSYGPPAGGTETRLAPYTAMSRLGVKDHNLGGSPCSLSLSSPVTPQFCLARSGSCGRAYS